MMQNVTPTAAIMSMTMAVLGQKTQSNSWGQAKHLSVLQKTFLTPLGRGLNKQKKEMVRF